MPFALLPCLFCKQTQPLEAQVNDGSQCVKTLILVQKLLFEKLLLVNLFEFLRQNSETIAKYFDLKCIKYLNFRAKNLDFKAKNPLKIAYY